jgi:NAD-dependent DNA ligase
MTDPHGQPYNVRFNRARRSERDLSEFLGLAKGLLADGSISTDESDAVARWIKTHQDAIEQWPLNLLSQRVARIYSDGRVEDDERRELAELLQSIVGGTAGIVLGEDAPTELPLDQPPPVCVWRDAVVVFTGKFAYGTRADCQRAAKDHGAICEADVTKRTHYLVIGTFGSRDWVHTSFGRKIQKAVEYREMGGAPQILGEDHWVESISRAG